MKKLSYPITATFLMAIFVLAPGIQNEEYGHYDTTLAYNISGVVLDKTTGEALTGVKVSLNKGLLITYTDFDGSFSLESNEKLPVSLSFAYISYQTTQIDLLKSGSESLLVNLQQP